MADGTRAVVLAAGHGTRMRSARPKVLHTIAGRTLLDHVIDLGAGVTGRPPIVIVSPAQPEVRASIRGDAIVVDQPESLGTGDALRSVPPELREPGTILVLSADVPLLRPATVHRLLAAHARLGAAGTLLVVMPDDPRGRGRIVRNADGAITGIVEERDLTEGGDGLRECNAGIYAFDSHRLWPALDRLDNRNHQGEYYLTDVVALLGGSITSVQAADAVEALGINDLVQLAEANAEARRRIATDHMLAGVTIEDPVTTSIDAAVRIGAETVIGPMTVLRGETVIGPGCRIGPAAQLDGVRVGARVEIGPSFLENCVVGDDVRIGPYNRVRPGSELRAGVRLGTHAEVKNSTVGEGSRINHFSCVLDAEIGRDVNFGAGSITVNYDGTNKHRTVIGDRAFVGSGSMLVAPLVIGEEAFVAAGSTITADVEAGALAVERAEARTVPGWVAKRRVRNKAGPRP